MITILMAIFNGEKYLDEQFESIVLQTYKDWHLIIRDDCSTDNSFAIAETFAKNMGNKVTLYRNKTPLGSAEKNFARLFKDALDAEYIMCCDQDDVWKPDKLEKSIDVMKKLEKKYGSNVPILVHGDVEVVDSGMNKIAASMFEMSHLPYEPVLSQLIIQNNVTGCTMLMNNCLLKGIAGIAGRDEIIMHDYLAALYAAVFGRTEVIREPLLYYRQHGDNSVGAKNSNNAGYLFNRFSSGKASYRRAMYKSQRQINFFAKVYGKKMLESGKKAEYKLFKEYGSLSERNHLKRLAFYFCNNVWKSGTIRKIMQCIWG